MTFLEWADFVNGFTGDRPVGIRLGQWAYNLLDEGYPEVAEKIRGSDDDPFYNDEIVPRFLCRLLTDFVSMEK